MAICFSAARICGPTSTIGWWFATVSFSTSVAINRQVASTAWGDMRTDYDVPGIARQRLQEKENVPQIFFNGCGGDITMGKYDDKTARTKAGLAQRLFAGMEASVAATKKFKAGPVVWRTHQLRLPPRTDEPGYTVADFQKQVKTGPWELYRAAMPLAFYARIDTPIEISSMQIGNVFILNLPAEATVEYQLYAQGVAKNLVINQSLEGFVAVAAYGDCGPSYVVMDRHFIEGGYEPSDSWVGPGSEAALKDGIHHLLGLSFSSTHAKK